MLLICNIISEKTRKAVLRQHSDPTGNPSTLPELHVRHTHHHSKSGIKQAHLSSLGMEIK